MITISRSAAGLRVFGDAVDPAEIATLLGSAPTRSHRKGDINPRGTGKQVVRKLGMWALNVDDRAPADLNGQVAELLSRLTSDIAVWQSIARQRPGSAAAVVRS